MTAVAALAPKTGVCPMRSAARPASLEADDLLLLPLGKSMIVQYVRPAGGPVELKLFHGAREIVFDEPELFVFGETLARQSTFAAGEAATWGEGLDWPRVRDLLQSLIDEGVLLRAGDQTISQAVEPGDRPAPLPPGPAATPRMWTEGEALMAELTGRPLEIGHLELVTPIFRVAHIALDADGRQVGEANVFPKALRLDTPTRWRSCLYAGSRHQPNRPMNVTALKAMRQHWAQMMAVLLRVREAYLNRFPQARAGWTVGHLERLATAVLAVPTWLMMRADDPVANGELHPALSCLFRVTDGLRMTMHQMLFVPIGEPTLPPDAPMTSAEVFAYAERNYSFHSEHGVCAGPPAMVEEFFQVIIDGALPRGGLPERLEPQVQAAIDIIEPALDYAFLGLQAYAAVFSLWPAMTRTYETLASILDLAGEAGPAAAALRDRFADHLVRMKASTYLGEEAWRTDRDRVFADMYGQCGLGLDGVWPTVGLPGRLAERGSPRGAARAVLIRQMIRRLALAGPSPWVEALADAILDFLRREQAVLRLAGEVQARINRLLGRPQPARPFTAADIDLHNQMQGAESRRLPYLLDELRDVFGVEVELDARRLVLSPV